MYKIQVLNNVSEKGISKFDLSQYEIGENISDPEAILLRSYKMHDMEFPKSLKAIGRAGAGVNNIPIEKLTKLGIPVFNTPGANANAVKELVLCALLMCSRNIGQALNYTSNLNVEDDKLQKEVEAGKKQYAGVELAGKTLGVIGLGAIGGAVANAASDLGMKVIGFDPGITVKGAWSLKSDIVKAETVEELASKVDYLTIHVPLIPATKNLIDKKIIDLMPEGVSILNFARDGIVDEKVLLEVLGTPKMKYYATDFPSNDLLKHSNVISLPHLGASTVEAEENCAMMIVDEIKNYLENGTIENSVNFPALQAGITQGNRVAVTHENIPNMVVTLSSVFSENSQNILTMTNKSRGDVAYSVFDLDGKSSNDVISRLSETEGVYLVRSL